MGNSTATGHVLQHTGLSSVVGFQNTLQMSMYQNNIQPWSASDLLKASLQRQTELAKKSPFRYINVKEGMAYFGQHCGGWVVQLNREKFVQLSLSLFASRGLTVPPEEAKLFYDVFDSLDLYKNATLSIGELAGGLSSFFGGTPDDRANAVYDLVAASSALTKNALQEFLKPYIWTMVPQHAAMLRPIFLPYVTDRMFEEVTAGGAGSYITREQLRYWMFRGSAMNYGPAMTNPMIMPEVTGNAVAERAAAHVEMAVNTAYAEYSARMGLREYGQQTWAQTHPGERQQLRDIGMARYVGGAAIEVQPTVWSSIGMQASSIGQQASVMASGIQQSATGLFNDFMRDRSGSTYSVDSSIIGTRTSIIGSSTLPIGTTGVTMLPPPPPPAPSPFQAQVAPNTRPVSVPMSTTYSAAQPQMLASRYPAPQPGMLGPTRAVPTVSYTR
jgi:hypothetical protein